MDRTPKKLFSLEEAKRTLPLVSVIVRDIRATFREYSEHKKELGRLRRQTMMESGARHAESAASLEKRVDELSRTLKGFVRELGTLGAMIKDPVEGIVDFPFEHDGTVAHFCWQYPDESITTWHADDEAVEDRKPLDETTHATSSECPS